jgi:hypothetical protein
LVLNYDIILIFKLGVVTISHQVTAIKYCKWCGKPFEVKSPNQKYCPEDISNCSQEAKRESWRKASGKYRNNYKGISTISQEYKLGSGLLSCHSQADFDKEYLAIQKEKKRLKLNGVMIGLSAGIQLTSRPVIENTLQRGITPFFDNPQLLILVIMLVGVIIFGVYHK